MAGTVSSWVGGKRWKRVYDSIPGTRSRPGMPTTAAEIAASASRQALAARTVHRRQAARAGTTARISRSGLKVKRKLAAAPLVQRPQGDRHHQAAVKRARQSGQSRSYWPSPRAVKVG